MACRAIARYITLERTAWSPPAAYPFDKDELVPFRAGEQLALAHDPGAACVSERMPLASRFRGFMPVVIDVECGGFNPNTGLRCWKLRRC
jgi:hypothetical protein